MYSNLAVQRRIHIHTRYLRPLYLINFVFFFICFLSLLCSVYNESLYQPLLDAILNHSHENSVCFLGLSRDFSKPAFFSLLDACSGLDYKKIPHATVADALPHIKRDIENIGIFVVYPIGASGRGGNYLRTEKSEAPI